MRFFLTPWVFFHFLICVLLSGDDVFGQNYSTRPSIKFKHLNLDLNNNMIEAISQDRFGYMWIGTLGGLHKYDGVNLKVYLSSNDSTSLSGNRVSCLFEDKQGRFWIGTENGIFRYNRQLDNFINYNIQSDFVDASDPTPNRVWKMVEDINGRVWIANERSGLHYLDEEKQEFVYYFNNPDEHVIARSRVVSLFTDKSGDIWVGTMSDGLARVDPEKRKVTHYFHDPLDETSFAGSFVENLYVDSNNFLWVATRENGLDKMDLNQSQLIFKHYRNKKNDPFSLYNDDVTTIFEDSKKRLWICNENGGLHLYNELEDNFFRYIPDPTDPFSISNVSVKVLFDIPKSDSALAQLLRKFNDMVGAIEARAYAERRLAERERFVSLGRLASSLAHEINNPLGGLLNATDTLRTYPDRPEVVRDAGDILDRGLNHLRDVTQAILDENRRDRSDRPLGRADFDDLKLLFEPETKRQSQALDWRINGSDADFSAWPSAPIRQIALNLLLNASSAAGQGGNVGCVVGIDSDTVCLTVTDGGPGLSQQAEDRLLSTTPLEPGGGVGLRLVRDLVAELGGEIAVARANAQTSISVRCTARVADA